MVNTIRTIAKTVNILIHRILQNISRFMVQNTWCITSKIVRLFVTTIILNENWTILNSTLFQERHLVGYNTNRFGQARHSAGKIAR